MRVVCSLALRLSLCLLLAAAAFALQKPKVITFGKPYTVKLFIGPDEDNTVPMKIRSLAVDGRIREFTTGEPHDITDRIFAVRRAFRLNNTLPADESKVPNWIWQRGDWLMVDRLTGRVSQMKLVNFDPFYSDATWFRDYVAYCGVSDSGDKIYAVVMQWGERKPLLVKDLGAVPQKGETPDSYCDAPVWERQPTRVIFRPKQGEKFSYTVFTHAVDAQPGSADEE